MYQELTEALFDSQEQQKSLRKRIKEYNPYKIPPDFELAKQHGIARRVCLPHRFTTFKNNPNALRCPCCELPFENQEIKLSCSLERLSHLGVCFPLYFIYIKFCFIVLGICLLSAGIVNLTYDLIGTNCEQIADSFICKISFLNVLSGSQLDGVENLKRQSLVNIISIFLMIVVFELFRNYQRKFALRHTHKYSISDFSLLLSFMPKNYRKEDVEDFVNFHLEKTGEPRAKIVKIYFLHQLGEYAKLYSDKRDLLAKGKQGPNGPDLNNPGVQTINNKLREIERLYNLNPITCTNGRVIVVFENIRPVRKLRGYFKKRIVYNFATYIYHYTGFSLLNDSHLYEGHYIKVSKAPEPSDIQWENLSAPSKLKAIRRITTLIVASILIVIGFTGLFLLKKKLKSLEQMTSTSDIGEYVSIVVSLVGALFVAITNTILGIFIRKFARYEKHKTHTSYFVTVGKRITAALVLNMIVTTTLANVFHSSKLHSWSSFFELSVTGLFYDVFFLFITNSYMSSIFNYFDFVWGFKLYRRHKALQDGTSSKLTQREAHSLFEGHPVDMALRFANVNKTLIFTGFFIPYIPLGLVFSMIGFAIVYWIDKYLLLRRYVCANKLSFSLPKAMLITGEWFIIAYALGNYFTFFLPLTDNGVLKSRGALSDWYFWISFVTLFAAVAYKFVIPKYFLHKLIIKFDDTKQDIDLETIIERLPEDYDNFHPVCRRQKFKASETLGMTIEEQDDEILVRGPTRRSSIASNSEDQSDSSNSPIIELNDVQDFKSDAETGGTAKNRRSRRQ